VISKEGQFYNDPLLKPPLCKAFTPSGIFAQIETMNLQTVSKLIKQDLLTSGGS
jgi:hypothetical protein